MPSIAAVAPWKKGKVEEATGVGGGNWLWWWRAAPARTVGGEEEGRGRALWLSIGLDRKNEPSRSGVGIFWGVGERLVEPFERAASLSSRATSPLRIFFQHQAELRLGSIFASFDEPSHEPARLGSILPLLPLS
jgi:hypothetical protein